MEEKLTNKIKNIISNRLLILSVFICICFYLLITRLFELQIILGEYYQQESRETYIREIQITAPRGNIYDKFGRPLAINKSAYNVKFDLSMQLSTEELNQIIFNLIELFESNSQEYIDELPISKERPYNFSFNNSNRELAWKSDMGINKDFTAEETVEYLSEFFGFSEVLSDEEIRQALGVRSVVAEYLAKNFSISKSLSEEKIRKALGIRSAIHMQRFRSFNPITLAYDVSNEIVVLIEEQNEKYRGVFVDIEPLRFYPEGKYFSHILGYIGRLSTEAEFNEFSPYGYRNSDIIGKSGLERAFELELNGEDGSMNVEVNRFGRRSRTVDSNEPVNGNDVYLTLDSRLQRKTFDILEETLSQTLKNKLRGVSRSESPIRQADFFSSMVNSNNISIADIFNSQEGTYSYNVKNYILSVLPEVNGVTNDNLSDIKKVITDGIRAGRISNIQMIFILYEQGILYDQEEYLNRIRSGRISTLQVILDKLDDGQITPQMTNLDPSTGSVVVVDVNTGDVLAAVSYPSYDNNEFVNNFNNEYYNKVFNDPTLPLNNRAFMEARAPGSTFKMISGIAALENGTIGPRTIIHDEVNFTKAGRPYLRSWSSGSLGSLDVTSALEVSSNFFFSEVTYRLGNARNGSTLEGIASLNKYMIDFGLNERSGVEIGEFRDSFSSDLMMISSPEYKEFRHLSRNSEAQPSEYRWTDGDTVRTSIGQAYNAYTAATMAKYIATLVRGDRYKLSLVDRIESYRGELVEKYAPVLETTVNIKTENLKAIHDGMLKVTEGSRGTVRDVFRDLDVRVAGKTGTAQEISNRSNHSSYGGFAPYDNPQIAVYVVIPFGDSPGNRASSSQVAKRVIQEYMGLNNEQENKLNLNSLLR